MYPILCAKHDKYQLSVLETYANSIEILKSKLCYVVTGSPPWDEEGQGIRKRKPC